MNENIGIGNRFFDRELSWLEFNARVLAEGMDPENLLFERLKFLGIVSSNLDEFFMVRVASLEEKGELALQVREKAYRLMTRQNEYFSSVMIPELEKANIMRVPSQGLSEKQLEFVKGFFSRELFPVLTPIALSEDRPVPILVNLSLYMVFGLVPIATPGAPVQYAVVEVPRNFPRMITLPSEKGYQFMLIENLIALFAKELFQGYEIMTQGLVRITRAAEMTLDEESDEDFSKVMMEALRKREQSSIIRLEAFLEQPAKDFLSAKLNVLPDQICTVHSWFDLKSIAQLAYQPLFPELKRTAWRSRPVPEFETDQDVWTVLKQKDVWVHHPYESFSAVVNFIAAAAADPDVLAIKQTLYRTGRNSAILKCLEQAAMKGKRVNVLVELKARFDEENNIAWARRLENAGASVLYGVTGFKTHAKACLVVRREPEGIRRYVHLSTGNYNEKTALIYSDIGYFSSDEKLANDVTAFFNMVTGFSQPTTLSKIVLAPFGLRRKLIQLIRREALRSTKEKPGLIMLKMNSLVDHQLIEELYAASRKGVRIKLHVRGICCLRPGVPSMSETIEVTSTVDMFLEHSRIFYFQNGGEEEVYLSSADWMPRNLDRRVEAMFLVENSEIKKDLIRLLDLYFKDNTKSWLLLSDGQYQKIERANEKRFRVQEYLCEEADVQEEKLLKSMPQELKPQKPLNKSDLSEERGS